MGSSSEKLSRSWPYQEEYSGMVRSGEKNILSGSLNFKTREHAHTMTQSLIWPQLLNPNEPNSFK